MNDSDRLKVYLVKRLAAGASKEVLLLELREDGWSEELTASSLAEASRLLDERGEVEAVNDVERSFKLNIYRAAIAATIFTAVYLMFYNFLLASVLAYGLFRMASIRVPLKAIIYVILPSYIASMLIMFIPLEFSTFAREGFTFVWEQSYAERLRDVVILFGPSVFFVSYFQKDWEKRQLNKEESADKQS